MNDLLEKYIKELKQVDTVAEYERFILKLDQMLQQERFEGKVIQKTRTKAKYLENKFSNESTKENMINAKNSLILYLSDIKIASVDSIIEAKCTRKTMTLKKLTEEIEADIVHYTARYLYLYFYIYDKEKIIKDKYTFETNFNKAFDGKKVRIIILQPVRI